MIGNNLEHSDAPSNISNNQVAKTSMESQSAPYHGPISYSAVSGPRRRRLDQSSSLPPVRVILPDAKGSTALAVVPKYDDAIYEAKYGEDSKEPILLYVNSASSIASPLRNIISLVVLYALLFAFVILSANNLWGNTNNYSSSSGSYDKIGFGLALVASTSAVLLTISKARGPTVILISLIGMDSLINLLRAHNSFHVALVTVELFLCFVLRDMLVAMSPIWFKLRP